MCLINTELFNFIFSPLCIEFLELRTFTVKSTLGIDSFDSHDFESESDSESDMTPKCLDSNSLTAEELS